MGSKSDTTTFLLKEPQATCRNNRERFNVLLLLLRKSRLHGKHSLTLLAPSPGFPETRKRVSDTQEQRQRVSDTSPAAQDTVKQLETQRSHTAAAPRYSASHYTSTGSGH
ncbi:UNVERIFIED_CONTAM: hypothetical protein FKN15_020714 [Acipenser sinensis]